MRAPAAVLALAFALGCEPAPSPGAPSAGASRAPVADAPRASTAPAPVAPEPQAKPIEIRACAPLEDGELRLLDVEPHTAARLIAIARRTPVIAAGTPTRGCVGGCRDLTLKGPAEADLATVGFEVTRVDGLLLASDTKPPLRRLVDGGAKIDIERERASFSDMVSLLAGTQRLTLAATPALAGELTIVARNVSGDRLLDAALALAGGRLRTSGKRVVLDGVHGLPPLGRLELANCAAPACPVVTARCSDARKLRLVAVMRRAQQRQLPQPVQLGEGIVSSDTSAFVEDEGGFAWHVRVGDHVGRDEIQRTRDGEFAETRRVEAISCGTVTLDDGSTITPVGGA